MKAEELDRSIAAGEIAPVYYLYGAEQLLVERVVRRLLERTVDPAFRDFNFSLFYGNECRGDEIVEVAQTLPMFAERRAILVKRASDLSAAAMELLAEYLRNPSPSTCLVLQGEKVDQRRKFFTELKKCGVLLEFKRLYENQLGPFIREELAGHGIRIEAAAVEQLVYYVGNNLRELSGQLDKLVTYAAGRQSIGVADVKEVVSDTKVDSVFELANALGRRDLTGALRCLQTGLREGDAPFMLVGALARHFRQLWQIGELQEKRMAQDEISKKLGISPYFLKGMAGQARNFKRKELGRIFQQLHQTDLSLKSGGRPQAVLEQLLFHICGSQ
ncbi:MAG TPA: DNA polymerase III subunit delta [Geobacteraceae bacterium]